MEWLRLLGNGVRFLFNYLMVMGALSILGMLLATLLAVSAVRIMVRRPGYRLRQGTGA